MILFESEGPVVLAGGGALSAEALARARARAGPIVAADGAADRLLALDARPDAVIGDLDSLDDAGGWAARGVAVHRLDEQDTTDFEKCLYATRAPLYLAVGFTGRRLDHGLAVLNAMARRPDKRVILVGESEIVLAAPAGRRLDLALAPGATVSVFPMAEVACAPSRGLEWPLDELVLAPSGRIGTSNRATGPVSLAFEGPGAMLLLPPEALDEAIAALERPT